MTSINFRKNISLKILAVASFILFSLILYSFRLAEPAEWYFWVFLCFIAVAFMHIILSLIRFRTLDTLDKIFFAIVPLPLLGYLSWLAVMIFILAKNSFD